jgi:hypothetical protein
MPLEAETGEIERVGVFDFAQDDRTSLVHNFLLLGKKKI